MIRDKYVLEQLQGRDYSGVSEDAARRSKKRDLFTFEKPLPPETLLRSTEDFSPILEVAFRSGITETQSRRTLRTIERVHRAKAKEMANWTAAMRRAEAAKFKAVKRIQEDMEVESLRAHLKTIRSRLDEKNKELIESSTFHQQIGVVRHSYERDVAERSNYVRTPEDGVLHHVPVHEEDGNWSTKGNSTTKKQRLYNALHYSAIYDELAPPRPSSTTPTPFASSANHSATRSRNLVSPDQMEASPSNVQLRGVHDTSITSSISGSPQNGGAPRSTTTTTGGGGDARRRGSSSGSNLMVERAGSPVRGTASSPLTASSYVIEL